MTEPMRARNGAHTVRIAISATPRRGNVGKHWRANSLP